MQKLIGFNIKRNKKLLVSDIIKFYEVRGYELIDADAHGMTFTRGNLWGNMTSLNPTKWKTKVNIEIIKKERMDYNIYATYKFTTSGFFRTKIEDNYYNEELNAFSKAIENFDIDSDLIETIIDKTNKSNFHLLANSLLLGIPTALLIILTINSLINNTLPIIIASAITAIAIIGFYAIFVKLRGKA
ncbi:hypothetical protein [Marinifilum flexuosum]|uniref:hypothetical protein n=1 Tax=Marinifilum flexuosum TaxID=1117708 RepID=UPI002495941F|nr:hypothetical protein [Marinifilum flexuosum]